MVSTYSDAQMDPGLPAMDEKQDSVKAERSVCTPFQVTIGGSLQTQCHGVCISGHHYLQSAELGLSEPRLREGSARSHSIVNTMLKA